MAYERTQPGNPHQLTVKQHVIPVRSIERFANANGRVETHVAGKREVLKLKPNDGRFWTRRKWDERTERFTKEIEDAFQQLADKIVTGQIDEIKEIDAQTVNRFYALWHQRSRCSPTDGPFIQMKGVTGSSFSKDQQETLEKHGVFYLGPGGVMPTRFITGIQLRTRTGKYAHEIAYLRWGVIRPLDGEFVMPDVPSHTLMPIAPKICLVASHPCGMIPVENLRQINAAFIALSQRYIFARDLRAACEGITWADIKKAGDAFEAASAA